MQELRHPPLAPDTLKLRRVARPHLVTNGGETDATFFLLQGVGEYDFVLLARVN